MNNKLENELRLLRSADHITDWFGPWDAHLSNASGIAIPNRGELNQFRDEWFALGDNSDLHRDELHAIAIEVARIFVPSTVQLSGSVMPEFDDDRSQLEFSDLNDFEQCFPTHAKTQIINRPNMLAWAAFALSDTDLGFGVFARHDRTDKPVSLTILPVTHEITRNLRDGVRL